MATNEPISPASTVVSIMDDIVRPATQAQAEPEAIPATADTSIVESIKKCACGSKCNHKSYELRDFSIFHRQLFKPVSNVTYLRAISQAITKSKSEKLEKLSHRKGDMKILPIQMQSLIST
jgi:hypothetical protein